MTLDHMLAVAAAAVSRMPEADLAVCWERLETEHRRRRHDDLARAKHAAFLDSLDLEQAAYELGLRNDKDGNLAEAARWYRVAADGDHADAALRLGEVLDLLADRCARQDDMSSYNTRREELHLISEAAQAYAEAYAAGHPEAADKIDEMLAAFARRQNPAPREPASAGPAEEPPCSYVRDFRPAGDVFREDEIQRLSRHAAQCLPCMEHFITLIKAAASAVPAGNITDPFAVEWALRR